ncbi:MAG: T9SS type A sorting domain-containing protein, partial [Saprospiraceae bacterium]
ISLYPNPTNDIIHITSSNTSFKDAQIIIYNESGKIAMTTGLQVGSNRYIDVSGLPSGFYIIKIIGDKAAYKAKFVKM